MLVALHIQNFAIVATLDLTFDSGMTTFTGETGAGKSIMIDALMLALGGRGDTSAVRPGTNKCDITAHFHIDTGSDPARWLDEHEINIEDNDIYLRRVISSEGRSKAYINGQPFPLQKVKELSEMLVDIHGQHQHQTLLKHDTHRRQLDQYANHPALLDTVRKLHIKCKSIRHALDELHDQSSISDRIKLLQYQVDELQALSLEDDEITKLDEEHKLLQHAQDFLIQIQHIRDCLHAEDHPDVDTLLNQTLQSLSHFPANNPHVATAVELINNALIQCEEARDEIEQFASQVQLDPERLSIIEERLSILHQTARKYHIDVKQLPEHLSQLETSLQQLQASEQKQADLELEYQTSVAAYEEAALELRHSRQASAEKLSDAISRSIQQLGMPKGYVTLKMTPLESRHIHGLDKVEYTVCTNPGMLPDTLAKVASGGELSRIGLAIQMITAQRASTPTLLFDEVDVGIGGATAALVGQLLRALGDRLQVFCVTHQPQVASYAHHHFKVEKHLENDQTFSEVHRLDYATKVDEIARMLGGVQITEQTLSHAKEMIEQA